MVCIPGRLGNPWGLGGEGARPSQPPNQTHGFPGPHGLKPGIPGRSESMGIPGSASRRPKPERQDHGGKTILLEPAHPPSSCPYDSASNVSRCWEILAPKRKTPRAHLLHASASRPNRSVRDHALAFCEPWRGHAPLTGRAAEDTLAGAQPHLPHRQPDRC